jgi:nucleotide-binding universal stress UspA family protein
MAMTAQHQLQRPGIRKILLASDLSPVSEAATDEAFAVASRVGAALLIVSVIDPRGLRLPGGGYFTRVDQLRARREAAAQALVRRGRDSRVRVTFLIWEGEPGEAILEAAAAEEADMIILGTHGRGPLGRLILGSVSRRVQRDARVPVVIVAPRAAISIGPGSPRPADSGRGSA